MELGSIKLIFVIFFRFLIGLIVHFRRLMVDDKLLTGLLRYLLNGDPLLFFFFFFFETFRFKFS